MAGSNLVSQVISSARSAAVSGGADSVCLALVLKELGYAAAVAHLNHGLRGQASDDDEAFTYNKRVNRLATVQEHYMIVVFLLLTICIKIG